MHCLFSNRRSVLRKFIFAIGLATSLGLPVFASPHDVEGVWLTQSGTSKVIIEDCGDGTPCGRIGWIDPDSLAPADRDSILTDRNNPDPDMQQQTLIGLVILRDFRRGGKRWKRGKIYDPESGKTYGSGISLNEDGTLNLKGCIGPFCQTQIWTRATLDD